MARPTKLTKELLEKAKTYLSTCTISPVVTEKGGVSYVDVKLPKAVSLALYLGISKSTLYLWCQEEGELAKEFSDIVTEVENRQEELLIDNGIGGLFQPKTTGMLLAKHGYSEKQEIDHTSKGESINDKSDIDLEELVKKVEAELKEKKTM